MSINHRENCPCGSEKSFSQCCEKPKIKWIRLRIKNTVEGGVDDEQGSVEFIATYKINGRAMQLHEVSRFRRSNGCWLYLDGEHPGTENPG
jgi:SEC-C motif-containing protein